MKQHTFFIAAFIVLSIQSIFSQGSLDTVSIVDLNLDLLKSPTNATFVIMNTSPTEIVEPGSTPEFFTSIQNSSNNFSAMPNNYGFAVTPFWWGKKAKELSFDRDFTEDNKLTFYRTLNLSAGVVQGIGDNENLWRYALGAQTTLFRGKIKAENKDEYFKKLVAYHKAYGIDFKTYLNNDPLYVVLKSDYNKILAQFEFVDELVDEGVITEQEAKDKREKLKESLGRTQKEMLTLENKFDTLYKENKSLIESSKELDKEFNKMNERYGFKLDVGTAISLNSENNKVDSFGVYRAGVWTNMSFTPQTAKGISNFTGVLLLRYLHFNEINYLKDEVVERIDGLSTFDIGGKIQYNTKWKFKLGIEYIYRMALSNTFYDSNYKLNGIVQYQIANNKLIYASFGNQFNDESDYGPEDIVVTFGVNIGIGDNIKLKDFKLN